MSGTLPNDTSPDVARMQVEIYRRMTPSRKWELLDGLYRMARELHAAGVRMNNSQATDDEVLTEWFRATLDECHLAVIFRQVGAQASTECFRYQNAANVCN